MKNASRTMYTIGKVLNIIALVLFVVFVIIFAIGVNDKDVITRIAQEQGKTFEQVKDAFIVCLTFFIVETVISLATVIIAFRATKGLKDNDGRNGPHIAMLVIGIVGFDIFYLLGAIFGLVSNGNRNQPQQ